MLRSRGKEPRSRYALLIIMKGIRNYDCLKRIWKANGCGLWVRRNCWYRMGISTVVQGSLEFRCTNLAPFVLIISFQKGTDIVVSIQSFREVCDWYHIKKRTKLRLQSNPDNVASRGENMCIAVSHKYNAVALVKESGIKPQQ